jgi:lincosamide nucleotidyltransferase
LRIENVVPGAMTSNTLRNHVHPTIDYKTKDHETKRLPDQPTNQPGDKFMLPQEQLIRRVRAVCEADEQLAAALMYGSFTKGEGDQYSDVEFYLFFPDDVLPELDQAAWVAQIAPVELYFTNEFGVGTAVFSNLVRGEFHFDPQSSIAGVRAWKPLAAWPAPEKMLVLDRDGELTAVLHHIHNEGPERTRQIPQVWAQFLNWILFGVTVLARGERARALEILNMTHRQLLWLARLEEGAVNHWATPSRAAEADLSPAACQQFRCCTADLAPGHLEEAYGNAWAWGKELVARLAARHEIDTHPDLIRKLDTRFADIL